MDANTNVTAKNHESYGTFTAIAVLLPIVGIILGIAYLTKDAKVDRKLGEHLLAVGVLFMIVWPLAWFVLYAVRVWGLR